MIIVLINKLIISSLRNFYFKKKRLEMNKKKCLFFQIFAKSSTTRLFTYNIYMSFARGYRDMTLKDKLISPNSMHTRMPLFINLEVEHWVVYEYIHYCHLPAWFVMQIVRGICCCMKYKLSGDIQRDVAKLQYNYPFLVNYFHNGK